MYTQKNHLILISKSTEVAFSLFLLMLHLEKSGAVNYAGDGGVFFTLEN